MNPQKDPFAQEKAFLAYLRHQSNLPLREAATGWFKDKEYPLEYAGGLVIGAGLMRCACGKWGKVDELRKEDTLLPCPHQDEPFETENPPCLWCSEEETVRQGDSDKYVCTRCGYLFEYQQPKKESQ